MERRPSPKFNLSGIPSFTSLPRPTSILLRSMAVGKYLPTLAQKLTLTNYFEILSLAEQRFFPDLPSHPKCNYQLGKSPFLWSASQCTHINSSRTKICPLLTPASDQATKPPHAQVPLTLHRLLMNYHNIRAAGLDSWRRNASENAIPIASLCRA